MFKLAYNTEVPSRPFRIHWHGKFLRSYTTRQELEQGLKFFKSFLLNIESRVYRNTI